MSEKLNRIKDRDTGLTEDVAQAARTVSQAVSLRASARPKRLPGSLGFSMPCLTLRGDIFHFRKRFPAALGTGIQTPFLCLSLRTNFLFVAVTRTSALLTVLE